jgi:hypothetical protein
MDQGRETLYHSGMMDDEGRMLVVLFAATDHRGQKMEDDVEAHFVIAEVVELPGEASGGEVMLDGKLDTDRAGRRRPA